MDKPTEIGQPSARVSGGEMSIPRFVSRTIRSPRIEFAVVIVTFSVFTILLTHPLAVQLGSAGYKIHAVGDAQYSVWNVAWVAYALLTDPLHLFDANIFYPHRGTLTYSEANLLAGALAAPVYWVSGRNPLAAHNFVVLLSFILSATGTYYLARYLVGDRRAAMIAAICFAYCPYVFSRLAHIQLLMTAGIPFGLLAFHRLVDRPSHLRGAVLGLTIGLQGLACGYYGVFLSVLMGPVALLTAASQRVWRNPRYWTALATAVVVATVTVLPLAAQYVALQRDAGFVRTIEDARSFSATWRTYLISGAYASAWLHDSSNATSVLFPGFIAAIGGGMGLVIAWRAGGRAHQMALLYGSLILLGFWLSLGPDGVLYALVYDINPAFGFVRAPNRFGLIVSFALSVLASYAIAALLRRLKTAWATVAVTALGLIALAEHVSPLLITKPPSIEPVYDVLAQQPYGAVLELPMYSRRFNFSRTRYMLASTVHWKPLVNGYSDHIPLGFSRNLPVLADFPSDAAFAALPEGVRYVVFHHGTYAEPQREALTARLRAFESSLRRIYADDRVWLYTIVASPHEIQSALEPHAVPVNTW